MSAGHRKHVDHCLNCGAPTPGAYCSVCGQEAVDASVTFRDQLAHFFEEVFTVESRLPQTVKLLLTRPGALTRAYNGGQRVRFVTPLKLYLFASVAFFLVLSLSASHASPHYEQESSGKGFGVSLGPPVVQINRTDNESASNAEIHSEEEFDEWLKKPENAAAMPEFVRPHLRSLIKSPAGFVSAIVDMLSKASMVLVPIHALLLKLLYWRPRRLYGEHIVFSLHLHSFAYIAYAVVALLGLVVSSGIAAAANGVVLLGGGAYSVAAARTAYGEGVIRSAFKMAVAGVGYGLALLGVLGIAAAGAFFES